MDEAANPLWTPKVIGDAYRTGIAMARAGYLNDAEGVAVLWNNAANQDALVWTLSRLPAVLIEAVSEREGETLDPEEVLGDLLAKFPVVIDPTEN